jgi:DNA polymerase III subunit delta
MASNQEGRELFKALARGQLPAPILLLYGDESFLVEEAIKAVRRTVLPDGGDDFSNQIFEGSEAPGLHVRQALENLSLFGGRRLIHVRSIDAMPAGELDALEPYLERPASETTLLLSGRTVDLRKRFFKNLKASKHALVVPFKALYDNELPDWVTRKARGKQLRGVEGDVATLVVELSGPELASMDSALDKLSLYAGVGGRVSLEDVRAVLDDTRTRNVFELTRQLGDGDLVGALNSQHRMLEAGESAVGIVSMIARHFRIVWKVQRGLGEGLRGRDLAQAAGCPPMFVGEYERDARRFGPARVGGIVTAVHDAERALKSSPLNDRIVLDDLAMKIRLG